MHKSNCEKELVPSFETPIVKKIYSLAQSENFALDLATKHFESYVMLYKENLQNAKKSLSMIHMYEQNIGARGSEYLNSYASDNEEDDHISFDKTNHGIGSGVYGLSHSQKSFAEMKQSVRDMKETYKSKYEIVEIEKPLHLHDAEGDKLSKLSKGLQRIGDQVHKIQTESRKLKKVPDNRLAILESNMDIQNELKVHAKTLKELTALKDFNLTDDDSYKILSQSLQQFLLDSKKSDHPIVAMPINYVISHLGFTGVVGEGNDTFSRGLISMKHSLPTVPIKVPTDTEKKILRENMEKYPADSKHLAKITYEKDTISNKIEESDFLSEENNVTQKETLPQNYTNQLNHSKAFKNPLFFNLSAKSEAEKNKVEEAKLATGAMGSHDNLNKTLVDGDKDLSEPTIPTIKSKI